MSQEKESDVFDNFPIFLAVAFSLLCGIGLGSMIQWTTARELRNEIQLLKAKHNAEIEVYRAALRRNGQWAQQ